MNGKGDRPRPPAFVPRCGTVRHVFLAGYDRCVCGERRLGVPVYRATVHEVEFPGSHGEAIPGVEFNLRDAFSREVRQTLEEHYP